MGLLRVSLNWLLWLLDLMLVGNESLLVCVTMGRVGLRMGVVGVVGMLMVVKTTTVMGMRMGVGVWGEVGLLWLRPLGGQERLFCNPVSVLLNY